MQEFLDYLRTSQEGLCSMDFVTKNANGKVNFSLEQAMKAQREVEV
jgi:hypothetical protein